MKYGKERTVHIKTSQYSDSHTVDGCEGEFKLRNFENFNYDGSTLGILRLSDAPVVGCDQCGAIFIAEEFEEWLEENIARTLLVSPGGLTKKQIRFLRQFFDLTQEELGEELGISKHELSKMESKNSSRYMDFDKQIRLRLLLANKLEFKKEDLKKIIDTAKDTGHEVQLSSIDVPKDVMDRFNKCG